MNLAESFRIAIRALAANKVRSALTMLGVIIGVAAVILLVSIGTGVQDEITGQIEGLGRNLLFVFPGNVRKAAGAARGRVRIRKQFTLDDASTMQSRSATRRSWAVIPRHQAPARSATRIHDVAHDRSAPATSTAARSFRRRLERARFYNRGEVVGQREGRHARIDSRGPAVSRARDPMGADRSPSTASGSRSSAYFAAKGGACRGTRTITHLHAR